jgi:hypothetical protein
MSSLTVFLARFIGFFTVLMVLCLLARGSGIIGATMADGPVLLAYAVMSLAIGLAMVIGHNIWSGGTLPVIVTLVGWLILAKGLLLALLTPEALAGWMQSIHYGQHPRLFLGPALLIGLYLTWGGFWAGNRPTQGPVSV